MKKKEVGCIYCDSGNAYGFITKLNLQKDLILILSLSSWEVVSMRLYLGGKVLKSGGSVGRAMSNRSVSRRFNPVVVTLCCFARDLISTALHERKFHHYIT